jgi:sec-independent protein translocase protein TatB
MFGLGFTEILLIAVLALLFIGPDKLPDTMKTIARTLGKLKRMVDDTKSTISQELQVDELRQEVMQYRQELDKAKNDLSSFKNVANKEIDSVKKSAQIESSFKATDINDDQLFDELFEEADSEFEALESLMKETNKNAQAKLQTTHEPKEEKVALDTQDKEPIGFKHLNKEDA